MKRSFSRPIIRLAQERSIQPSRAKFILCLVLVLGAVMGLYIFLQQYASKTASAYLGLKTLKPPLVDRSMMQRLGMYDEAELIDKEWMSPQLFRHSSHGWTSPLSITRLPDTKSFGQDKYISNALADWKLCGFRDRPCLLMMVCPSWHFKTILLNIIV